MINGVKLPKYKSISKTKRIGFYNKPKYVYVPLVSGKDTDITITVKKGDYVYKGSVIGRRKGDYKISICSSISGTVIDYVQRTISTGEKAKCVVIENDFKEKEEIKVTPADDQEIYVSGSTIGIYMQTEGVLVIDTGEIQNRNGETEEPARNIIRQGDYIISFNGEKISTKRELIDDISELDGSEVTLGISRKGESIPVSVTPVKDKKGDYKLGIWVRDDTQGIGTLTYVDQNGNYGALGHGISDIDTAQLLNIRNGALYKARILAINKGSKGNPGELAGYICYDDRNILGTIEANSRNGIYGQFTGIADDAITLKKMPAAYKQEVKIGTATILCSTDGEVKEYDAEIRKIDLNHEDTNKSFVIKVTDKELLEATGGIVQGLSGSPVIQNGKIIGAVTHVFVQDASSGYGIFIENMLKNTERLF